MTLLFSIIKVLFEIARVDRAGFFFLFFLFFLFNLKDKWSTQVTFETVWVILLKSKSRQSHA